MSTTIQSAVNSNTELEKLSNGDIGIIAEYAFQNPYSINGPFGTMELTLSSDHASGENIAIGSIKINTLWGLGSSTNLHFDSVDKFNGSTGYTSINTEAKGSITVRPNPPKLIRAKVIISLEPGFHQGTISIEGFFSDFQIKATSIHYSNE
ncbi:hypothetical protein [uncultured Tenacibaculum sp.]|uniref:hypothetical protein n=1 Tax=uncultured Tenacibaculum sp. TaxID=174713 RepID=UPI002631FD1F|nr:hypothetical protein [uncultured Tenacibaculum sp.]